MCQCRDRSPLTWLWTDAGREFAAFVDGPKVRGSGLLHLAVADGNLDACRALLQCGADPSVPGGDGKKLLEGCDADSDLYRVFETAAVTAIVTSE